MSPCGENSRPMGWNLTRLERTPRPSGVQWPPLQGRCAGSPRCLNKMPSQTQGAKGRSSALLLEGEVSTRKKATPWIAFLLTALMHTAVICLGNSPVNYIAVAGLVSACLVIGHHDRRIFGYVTVLMMANPFIPIGFIPFGPALGILFLIFHNDARRIGLVDIHKMRIGAPLMLLLAGVLLSIPFWDLTLRNCLHQVRYVVSFIGLFGVIPLTCLGFLRKRADYEFVVLMLLMQMICIMAIVFFFGNPVYTATAVEVDASGRLDIAAGYDLGALSFGYVRTQVSILLAVLMTGGIAAVLYGPTWPVRALFGGLVAVSGYILIAKCSVASMASLALGVGVLVADALMHSPKHAFKVLAVCGVIGAIVWYGAQSDYYQFVALRIQYKADTGNDRSTEWMTAIDQCLSYPFGKGFTTTTDTGNVTHNDYLTYAISYGIIGFAGFCGLVGRGLLHWVFAASRGKRVAAGSSLIRSVGLGTLVVYGANAMFDVLTAQIVYFQIVWALILVALCGDIVSDTLSRPTDRSPWSGWRRTSLPDQGR